jgi:predicted nucleic acid-binding protein
MADFYADSSVLVKRHINEVGSDWFRMLADPAAGNVIITARVSMVEVYSAFNRRLREANLDPADYTQLATDFSAVCLTEYELVELTSQVVERARLLLEYYPLRAYDAVQLASALMTDDVLQNANLPSLTFLTADDRLLNAAQAESLATDNPNLHS